MRTTFLVLLLNILLAATVAQRTSQSEQSTRSEAVAKRGDHVMGFSHEATTHHFHLLKGGGEIVVTTNDPSDKTSVEQIRTHLKPYRQHVLEWRFQCRDADSRHQSAWHGDNGASKVQHSLHNL